MDDICKTIEDCNPNKKCKILIVFDDMITDMLSNKKLYLIVTESCIRIRRLNIYLVFTNYTILFWCTKKHKTKFYGLFCYENSKQMRGSINRISSFTR